MAELRFYLDENLPIAIAAQLLSRGVVVATVRDLGLLGDTDANHLTRAARMGYVLCTYDSDYIALAKQGIVHAGIIIGQAERHWVGEWVNGLTLYHTVYGSEEMLNRLEFL